MDLTDNQVAENMNSTTGGHQALSATDPDNPPNWPLRRKLYVSSVSFAFVFAMSVNSVFLTKVVDKG